MTLQETVHYPANLTSGQMSGKGELTKLAQNRLLNAAGNPTEYAFTESSSTVVAENGYDKITETTITLTVN